MEPWEVALASIVTTFIASSGFWAYLLARYQRKSATTRLLMGLAIDKISFLGLTYLDRGSISKDEYDDFVQYLYGPYEELGGNGTAKRMMAEVEKLPFERHKKYNPMEGSNDQPNL